MVQRLDEGMQSLAEVIKKNDRKRYHELPPVQGAAGGMGGGLLAFLTQS